MAHVVSRGYSFLFSWVHLQKCWGKIHHCCVGEPKPKKLNSGFWNSDKIYEECWALHYICLFQYCFAKCKIDYPQGWKSRWGDFYTGVTTQNGPWQKIWLQNIRWDLIWKLAWELIWELISELRLSEPIWNLFWDVWYESCCKIWHLKLHLVDQLPIGGILSKTSDPLLFVLSWLWTCLMGE